MVNEVANLLYHCTCTSASASPSASTSITNLTLPFVLHEHLTSTRVEEVAAKATQGGQGMLVVKGDNRLVPVHPQHKMFQVVSWNHSIFANLMLPFRLPLALKVFNARADILQWHLTRARVQGLIHNLDDYIRDIPPNS